MSLAGIDPRGFPGLHSPLNTGKWKKTSDISTRYNCAAYAAGEQHRKWWPAPPPFYWPPSAPRQNTIDAFIAAYATLGYKVCVNGDLEQGVEKIAFFADLLGNPLHVSRQLANGKWTSKLGDHIDIQHDSLLIVSGPAYGQPVVYMSRPRKGKAS